MKGLRRAAALGAVIVATGSAIGEWPAAREQAAAVMGGEGTALADRVYARFVCLDDVVEELPAVPTYVRPYEGLPEVEWYQRAIEMGFGELPLVEDVADAEQILEFVLVGPGAGRCDDVDVRVRPT